MGTHMKIVFDNSLATYHVGQTVTGRIVINLSKEKKFRAIEIRYLGQSRVAWKLKGGDKNAQIEDTAQEIHIDRSIVVAGGSVGETTLSPGEYTYRFSLNLPTNIPSSFEGGRGHVRYTVRGKIVRPWKFDHECRKAFTVLNILDLNAFPAALVPVKVEGEKNICCWHCRSGPITVVITAPITGFVPGQTIRALFEIDNMSNEWINGKVELFQLVTYKATTSSREVRKRTAKQDIGMVGAKMSKTFTSSLLVPPLPDSFLDYCQIINISYYLHFTGSTFNFNLPMQLNIPLTVGSIPLRNQFSLIVPPEEHNPNCGPTLPPEFKDCYPDAAPSYEESMMGKINIRSKEDNDYIQGDLEFTPRYPVYRFRETDRQN